MDAVERGATLPIGGLETATDAQLATLELVRSSVIGEDAVVDGPNGRQRVVYADYTASGRALRYVEDVIRDLVLPRYASTHSETSGTGRQTTRFREDARALIRDAVGGDADEHAVLFCGSGSTAAIDRMVHVLGLRVPAVLDDRYGWSRGIRRRRSGRTTGNGPVRLVAPLAGLARGAGATPAPRVGGARPSGGVAGL